MSSICDIVILGASYSGLGAAHSILRVIPKLEKTTGRRYRVTLISNSSHFWFSVGAPRAMLKPYPKDVADSFIPITQGFQHYPSSSYDFILAEITAIDTERREVVYRSKDAHEQLASTTSTVHYTSLIIATGSTGPSPLYSIHGSHNPTLSAYKEIQSRLPAAKSVLVIGGGPAGAETAGELGYLHGKGSSLRKEIIIMSGNDRLLTGLRPAISARAEQILIDMGVEVIHSVRLQSQTTLPDGRTRVTLSNGETREIDILITATGRRPATSFLPPSIQTNESGHVIVDPYLRVPSQKSTYATGDVASSSDGGLMYIQAATPVVAGNVLADLARQGEKGIKRFKPMTTKETQLVPLGPSHGVGTLYGWRLSGTVVRMLKGKNMFFPKAVQTVMGTA